MPQVSLQRYVNQSVIDLPFGVSSNVSPADRKNALADKIIHVSNSIYESSDAINTANDALGDKLKINLKFLSDVIFIGSDVSKNIKDKYFEDDVFFVNLENSYHELARRVDRVTRSVGDEAGVTPAAILHAMDDVVEQIRDLKIRYKTIEFDKTKESVATVLKYVGGAMGIASTTAAISTAQLIAFYRWITGKASETSAASHPDEREQHRWIFDLIQASVVVGSFGSLVASLCYRYGNAKDERNISHFISSLSELSYSFIGHMDEVSARQFRASKCKADTDYEKIKSAILENLDGEKVLSEIKRLSGEVVDAFESVSSLSRENRPIIRGLDDDSCGKYISVVRNASGVLEKVDAAYLALDITRSRLMHVTTGCLAAARLLHRLASETDGTWSATDVADAFKIFSAKLIEAGEMLNTLVEHERPSIVRTIGQEAKEFSVFVVPLLTAAIGLNVAGNASAFAAYTRPVIQVTSGLVTLAAVAAFIRDFMLGRLRKQAADIRFTITQAGNVLESVVHSLQPATGSSASTPLEDPARQIQTHARGQSSLADFVRLASSERSRLCPGMTQEDESSRPSSSTDTYSTALSSFDERLERSPLRRQASMSLSSQDSNDIRVDLIADAATHAPNQSDVDPYGGSKQVASSSRSTSSEDRDVLRAMGSREDLSNVSMNRSNVSDSIPLHALPSGVLRRRGSILPTVLKSARDRD